jgi:hypothetical protein
MGIREEVKKRVIQKRSGLGGRDVLSVHGLTDTDQFHYHWINDIGDRLHQRFTEGYDFVEKNGVSVGDITVESARGTDSLLKKAVGRGVVSYLMKIPMELYNEYQAEKRAENALVDEEIKGSGKQAGMYGEVKISA